MTTVADAPTLREAAVSGVRWVMLSRLAAELGALAGSIVLARLIPPAAFGRAAIALVLPLLAVTLTFDAFGAAIVQRRRLARAELETAALLSPLLGVALAFGMFALGPVVVLPLFGAETSDLVRLLCPVFALAGAAAVSRALLQRRLAFRRIAVLEVVALATGVATSLTLAVAGLDAEALVLGALATAFAETALLIRAAPPPRPRLRPGCLREIGGFGLPAAAAGVAYAARRNVDYVILGAQLAPAQVGFYWRAFQLAAEYQAKASGIVQRLVFPLFSRIERLEDRCAARLLVLRVNSIVVFPLLATLVVLAPTIVPWLYGPRWEPAVVPVQILAVSGLALAVLSGTEPMALALGRPRALLAFNAAFFAVYAVAIFLAATHGLAAVCAAASSVHVVMALAGQRLLLGRVTGMSLPALWRSVAPAAVSSAALLAAAAPAAMLLSHAGLGAGSRTLAVGLVAATTYVVALRWLFPAAWEEAASLGRRLLAWERRSHPIEAAAPAAAEGRA